MGRLAAPRPFLARLRRATARRSGGAAVAAALVLAAGAAPTAAQGLVPEGSEFHVNTYTTSDQTLPAVAMATGGAFVVVWESDGQDGDSYGVFAQRHGAGGTSVGGAFRVNTHTTLYQGSPAVAMDADGDFVVTWMSAHDGAGSGIFAQRYDATGMPQGAEFPVSAGATLLRGFPSVAMDASGAFVVTWQSGAAGSDDVDIYARRYDAAGVPLGEEFEVNTYTTGTQALPHVAMNADGDFVVAWQSYEDGDDASIHARRYHAAGEPEGLGFQVNTRTTGSQVSPAVAMDADGGFVAVWTGYQEGSGFGLYARSYDAAAVPQGADVHVEGAPSTGDRLEDPALAMTPDGAFALTWSGPGEGGARDVYARAYAEGGTPVGEAQRVNTFTGDEQYAPSVAMSATGDVVVAWSSRGQEGGAMSAPGVYAQRYRVGTVAAEPGPAPGLTLAVAPSPMTGSGLVRYVLPEATRVRVALYDVLGREVAVLADAEQGAGRYDVALDAGSLAPGAYLVRLTAGETALVRRVTVVR